jgi:8-oxo-dGTP pyrophosphatase MutT (NUDIX family)
MSQVRDRAVSVVFSDDRLLVMGRQKNGRAYCVLPGGGVEPGEAPEAAALRELAEETGLAGTVQRHLWTIEHQDRRAHYFLVSVVPGPMSLGGPEAAAQSEDDVYTPQWLPLNLLEAENLQPDSMCALLREANARPH